jgi:hypothetical protein
MSRACYTAHMWNGANQYVINRVLVKRVHGHRGTHICTCSCSYIAVSVQLHWRASRDVPSCRGFRVVFLASAFASQFRENRHRHSHCRGGGCALPVGVRGTPPPMLRITFGCCICSCGCGCICSCGGCDCSCSCGCVVCGALVCIVLT